MTRKQWMLIAAAILLGGFSLYLNKDWFAKDNIQIFHRSRPLNTRRKSAEDSAANPVMFGFDRRVKLTSVKVFPLSDISTNKYPHPIWELVSDSNSVPTKEFLYGSPIAGMRPAVQGATPDPLDPGVPYRLFIEAGNFKAEHDFVPVARAQ